VTLKPGSEVTQGHQSRHGSIPTYDFLLTLHVNHEPVSYRFRDKRRFQSKIAIIPSVFNAPAEGVPLRIGYWRWRSKTRMMGLPGGERSLTISSAMWIQYTNVTDGQTDGHRTTEKPRLCIASCGKMTQNAPILWTLHGVHGVTSRDFTYILPCNL